MAWLSAHWAVVLLIISEILPLVPGVESNSIGQLILSVIRQLLAKEEPKA